MHNKSRVFVNEIQLIILSAGHLDIHQVAGPTVVARHRNAEHTQGAPYRPAAPRLGRLDRLVDLPLQLRRHSSLTSIVPSIPASTIRNFSAELRFRRFDLPLIGSSFLWEFKILLAPEKAVA